VVNGKEIHKHSDVVFGCIVSDFVSVYVKNRVQKLKILPKTSYRKQRATSGLTAGNWTRNSVGVKTNTDDDFWIGFGHFHPEFWLFLPPLSHTQQRYDVTTLRTNHCRDEQLILPLRVQATGSRHCQNGQHDRQTGYGGLASLPKWAT